MNNDVDSSDFPPEVTSTLPNLPFVIPKDEIKKRRDFRKHCVFTIDPLTGNTFWNTIQQNVITSVSQLEGACSDALTEGPREQFCYTICNFLIVP